jgi:hypothetical protein
LLKVIAAVSPHDHAMDSAPVVIEAFTTRAPRDAVVEALCRLHESVTRADGVHPIDVDIDGRRCTFGLVPPNAELLHVRLWGDGVELEAALERDVILRVRAKVERRLLYGDAWHANTYTVSPWSERSPALRDLGLLTALVGGAAFLAAPIVGGAGALVAHPLFCFTADRSPCAPGDATPYTITAVALALGGATLFGVGLEMFYAGRAKVALVDRVSVVFTGSGLRVSF